MWSKGPDMIVKDKIMIREHSQADLIARIQKILAAYPEILIAILFGSAGKGRLTAGSDIDIAVAAGHPLSYEQKNELHRALSRALPYEVDLIDLQSVSGVILQQALCTGVIVQKKSPAHLAALLKKMWFNQADMMPYTRLILKKHSERFVNG